MIDRLNFPVDGNRFISALHGPLFLSLSGARPRWGDYPKLFLAPFAIVPGRSPNLVNLWSFVDQDTGGELLGGIPGPTERPDRDYDAFNTALKAIRRLDAAGYAALVERIEAVVRAHVVSRPDRFAMLDRRP